MFKKKTCKNCGKKINSENNFCSNCGFNLKNNKPKENKKNWGMLGKNDEVKQEESIPGMNGGMLGKMLQGAMKMLEKEIQKDMKQQNQQNQNFKLMINGKEIKLNEKKENSPTKKLPSNILRNFSKYPKQEPATKVKRLGNKLIYEINIPEVKSIENISIMKLEESIEIKALSKDKAYKKIIPLNLEITNYDLSDEKLILEMEE